MLKKKIHWFIRRLGVKHQLIADGKNINIKEKWGGKKGVYIGDQGLACYSLQTFITFHMMQTTVSPTLAGIAHHLVMKELKRHKGTGTEKSMYYAQFHCFLTK